MQAIAHLKLRADLENLERTRTLVSECASAQHFGAARVSEIELALEEAFANICNYAYAGQPGEIEVNCFAEDGGMVIELTDSGISFDITIVDDPDITADLSEREPGGLGIFLIRELIDEVVYRREGDKNILRLFVARES
ncbi:MAG: anti-sigma regulatory factor [uncultured bacterium]|nr:MAG: anti-sigma regulatory factor [uncultured bacterium]